MATLASRSEKSAVTPRSAATIEVSPSSLSTRVLKTPLSDETIWKRLKEAGFDEESIKRRDKAALIAYIAKLEAEVLFCTVFNSAQITTFLTVDGDRC